MDRDEIARDPKIAAWNAALESESIRLLALNPQLSAAELKRRATSNLAAKSPGLYGDYLARWNEIKRGPVTATDDVKEDGTIVRTLALSELERLALHLLVREGARAMERASEITREHRGATERFLTVLGRSHGLTVPVDAQQVRDDEGRPVALSWSVRPATPAAPPEPAPAPAP